jgi:hypothetical protein
MKFELYYENLNSRYELIKKKIGIANGISFKDACYNYTIENKEFSDNFNLENLTYKNFMLYGILL